ncbi:Activin-like protein [Frankliniella occidentalis]|uniref:Inhibin beta E chain n=1 Tax=Frankliniella occidentalis TaxID=133901 RepID=A0A6J1SVL1_FRAOC|nr:inhibin beta E chain [Frankliniella occidentalis]KAE8750446.1 Activin-like protein [Frankliniella occidentalis]
MQLPVVTRTLLVALVAGLVATTAPPTAPAQLDAAAPSEPAAGEAAEHRHLGTAWSTLFSAEGSPPHRRRHHHRGHHQHAPASCPSCGLRREMLEEGLNDDLTALRIEFVKQQILKKLGLKEPPKVNKPSSVMPKPLALAGLALPVPPRRREDDSEDFYGRTDQVILFPTDQDGKKLGQCPGDDASPAKTSCFLFKLPPDIQAEEVTQADLWLYRRPLSAGGADNVTLAVSEVANWDLDESFQRRSALVSEPVIDKEGWVKLDLARAVKFWFQYNELLKMVEAAGVPVEADGAFKPFLVIATSPGNKVRRSKRNAKCVPGMAECCRDNLYVSFKDIGWDDWILQPLGYEAYFCRGSCTTAASLTITGSHHNAIIRRLMQTGKKVDLVPCCTPTKYSEISLLYINNNNTYIQKTLPNMVVEACGCN